MDMNAARICQGHQEYVMVKGERLTGCYDANMVDLRVLIHGKSYEAHRAQHT